ncbi:AraC-like ligand-binding domain-containing protein [Streptomyces gardneri]|uniref:AraC-like ligand-binding domain-containing protein n=1 Tax=Streptomyces gardneri TaxID=66892 RepID=UPI0035D5567D
MSSTEGFEWFCDVVSNGVMPVSLSPVQMTDFHAEAAFLDLGSLQLSAFTLSPVLSRRTQAHVRKGDPEHYQLALVTRGSFRISQRGHQSVVADGLVLTDSSRPSEGASVDGLAEAVILQIPRSALPLRHDKVDGLVAQHIRADRGAGAILSGFLCTLLAQGPTCQPSELAAMGSIALDLATTCLAQQLGTYAAAPAEARAMEMFQRVTRYIENNLGDPDLTPQAIADRHNISLRALYSLFREQSVSVAARIRQVRLERARADLERPELSSQPVQAIAARWGFSSANAFGRAFRDAYGTSPSEHRAAALWRDPARSVERLCTLRPASPVSET